jgi:hypothetical protein
VTLADWAKDIGDIARECDDLETWGIEVGYLTEFLELVSDAATHFPELLRPCDKARWEQVNYLIGLLRKAGENIERTSGAALQKAEALSELARQRSAASDSRSNAKTEDGQ